MADIAFAALKLGFKAYKSYREQADKFAQYEEDLEELCDRLEVSEAILLNLEGRLNDSLALTLNIMKRLLDKCTDYTDKLQKFVAKNKGSPLKAIARAGIASAMSQLPVDLLPFKDSVTEFTEKLGALPEDKFKKFADDLHFYVSAAAASASTQQLVNSGGKPGASPENVEPATVSAAELTQITKVKVKGAEKEADFSKTSAAEMDAILAKKLQEEMAESKGTEALVIYAQGRVLISPYRVWIYAVWIEGSPFVLFAMYMSNTFPNLMTFFPASSTAYLVELSRTGLLAKPGMLWGATKDPYYTRDKCIEESAKAHCMTESSFRWNHVRSNMNKGPFMCCMMVGIATCLFRGNHMKNAVTVNGTKYSITLRNSTCLFVNDTLVYDSGENNPGIESFFHHSVNKARLALKVAAAAEKESKKLAAQQESARASSPRSVKGNEYSPVPVQQPSSDALVVADAPVAEIMPPTPPPAAKSSQKLSALSISDVCNLLEKESLGKANDKVKERDVTGDMLGSLESVEELQELLELDKFKARLLFKKIEAWKADGVPSAEQ